MMKTNFFRMQRMAALTVMAAAVLTFGSTACSGDDDKDNNTVEPGSTVVTTFDDLSFFQSAIIRLDTLGNFAYRAMGTPLYDSDTTHLYIGVDKLAEAEEFFRSWVAPDVELTAYSIDGLTAHLTDRQGKAQGTVCFKPGTESGHVAEVTASADTKLKHFSQITFLLNSAWPYNAAPVKWHKGDIVRNVRLKGIADKLDDKDKRLNFVCIRSGGNGYRSIFCAITRHQGYKCGDSWFRPAYWKIVNSKYCPGEVGAKLYSRIMTDDWDMFEVAFEEAGSGMLTKSFDNWIYPGESALYKKFNYFTGEIKGWKEHREGGFLLEFDWVEDKDIKDNMEV